MNQEIRKKDIIIIVLAVTGFALIGLLQFAIQSELAPIVLATLLILISMVYGIKSIFKRRIMSRRIILLIVLYVSQFIFYLYTIIKGDYFLFSLLAVFITAVSLLERLLLSRTNVDNKGKS